jgi:hypothetical protein
MWPVPHCVYRYTEAVTMRTRDPIGSLSTCEEVTANVFYRIHHHMLTPRKYSCSSRLTNRSSANLAKPLKCAVTNLTRIGIQTLFILISFYTAPSATFTVAKDRAQFSVLS